VHARLRQRRAEQLAELVPADATDERHARAEARGGHGLVGALAARMTLVVRAEQRLARRGVPLDPDDEVEVRAADHRHPSALLTLRGRVVPSGADHSSPAPVGRGTHRALARSGLRQTMKLAASSVYSSVM